MEAVLRAEGISYTKSDLRILEYIENHTEEFLLMSIGQLAAQLRMSEATVSRFVRHIGCGDFKELKSLSAVPEPELRCRFRTELWRGRCGVAAQWFSAGRASPSGRECPKLRGFDR